MRVPEMAAMPFGVMQICVELRLKGRLRCIRHRLCLNGASGGWRGAVHRPQSHHATNRDRLECDTALPTLGHPNAKWHGNDRAVSWAEQAPFLVSSHIVESEGSVEAVRQGRSDCTALTSATELVTHRAPTHGGQVLPVLQTHNTDRIPLFEQSGYRVKLHFVI